jgi:hypothetical protein
MCRDQRCEPFEQRFTGRSFVWQAVREEHPVVSPNRSEAGSSLGEQTVSRRQGRQLANILFWGVVAALIFLNFVSSYPRKNELNDFGSFVASGRASVQGADPYAVYPLTGHVAFDTFDLDNPNLNPPISVLLFRGLATFNPDAAFRWWYAISFCVYGLTLLFLARTYPDTTTLKMVGWALCLAGLWHCLYLGQVYLALLALAALAWILLDRKQFWGAGILLGFLAAFKPNFLVWPVLLLVAGYWMPAVVALLSTFVFSAIPLAFLGPQVYSSWLHVISAEPTRIAFPTNSSLPGMAARLGLTWPGTLLSLCLVVLVAILVRRHRPGIVTVSGLAICVLLLVSPITWVTYTLFLLPIFFGRRWTPLLVFVAVLLVLPTPVYSLLWLLSKEFPVAAISPSNLALIALMALLTVEMLRQRAASGLLERKGTQV